MANEPDDLAPADDANSTTPPVENSVIDCVQELTWALVDEQINEDEIGLLDNLLLSDDQARETYIGCVQLHTDLLHHFADAAPPNEAKSSTSPVLGFLNTDSLPVGVEPPKAEDSPS